jgi:ABC-type transport system involved in multi-copper enzyme maturation permease subunit
MECPALLFVARAATWATYNSDAVKSRHIRRASEAIVSPLEKSTASWRRRLAERWGDWALFGPLLPYDLVRSARGPIILHRALYILGLGLVLYVVFAVWFPELRAGRIFETYSADLNRASRFANSFFTSIVVLQFAVVILVAPAYTATPLAAEKANGTLELLLATHLTSREIVLSILTARVANLVLLLLAGVPVLAILPFFGGIEPLRIFASFCMVIVTLLAIASISMVASVLARSPLSAVLAAYCFAVPYGSLAAAGSIGAVESAPGLQELAFAVAMAAAYQSAVIGACLLSAISALRTSVFNTLPLPRPTAVSQGWDLPAEDTSRADQRLLVWRRLLPAVGDDALMWKEMHVRPLLLANETRSSVTAGLIVFVGGFLFVLMCAGPATGFFLLSNIMTRILAIFPAFVGLMAIAFNAANRVAREREGKTFDSLLLMPLSRTEILFAKWKASILSYRWIGILVGAVWLAGLLTGGLNVLAAPLVVLALGVYVALVASLGLWFSLACKTIARAMLATALTAGLLLAGPGLPWKLFAGLWLRDEYPSVLFTFLDVGLSPVQNLVFLTFGYDGIALPTLLAALAGLGCHATIAYQLWIGTCRRLENEKGPLPASADALDPEAGLRVASASE